MDVLLTVLYCLLVLSVLVFIHEGGHFLTARMFGIRVTEFMLGLPGPRISFKHNDTRYGVTCILLGGYARVCGMEPGNMKPFLPEVLKYIHTNGYARVSQVAKDLTIKTDDAEDALDELVEWGCVCRPTRQDLKEDDIMYYAADISGFKKGEPREVKDKQQYFKSEYFKQYRSLPFWRRSIILLAGIAVNLLFAMLIFIVLYSIVGVDLQNTQTGEISHVTLNPLQAIQSGFIYIWMVIQAVINLFNPVTAGETIQNSTSLIGIAVISKSAAEAGIWTFLNFMAMISVSLGIMNLLPIPPLDGGRFLVEIFQRIFRRNIPEKVLTIISLVGIALFLLLFVVMMNQDIQRFILR